MIVGDGFANRILGKTMRYWKYIGTGQVSQRASFWAGGTLLLAKYHEAQNPDSHESRACTRGKSDCCMEGASESRQ